MKMIRKLLAALCIELLAFAPIAAPAQIAGPVLPQLGVTPPGVSPRQFCAKTSDGKCWPFMTQDPVTGAISITVDPNTLSSALLPHVANLAGLKSLFPGIISAVRDGFSAAGDGGAATYTHSSAPCSLNAGLGDKGAQVPDSLGTGCWMADLSKPISAAVWGVKADDTTDDLAAWQAATSAMGAVQGDLATMSNKVGVLLFPQSNGVCSRLSATLLINRSSLIIRGGGPHSSCFDPQFAVGNGVQFGDPSHYILNDKIEDVSFRSDVTHRTGGNSLAVYNAYYFNATDVGCYDYFYSCFGIDQTIGGNDYNFDRVFTSGTNGVTGGAGVFGFTIGQNSTIGTAASPSSGPVEVRISRSELDSLGYGGTIGAALNLYEVGGLYTRETNSDFVYQSAWVHPATGQLVSAWVGFGDNWDTQTSNATLFDTTGGGRIANISLRNEWIATTGNTSSGYTGAAGVLFQGPTDTIQNVDLDFQPLFAAGGHGVVINSGTDIRLSGHIGGNGLQNVGSYNGVVISPPAGVAVKDVKVDARLGGSFGVDGSLPPNMQNCGLVTLGGGGSITNLLGRGDWSGNRNCPSGLGDGDTADQATHDFSGTFPGVGWTAFAPALSCVSGSFATSGLSSSMRYQVNGKTVRFSANFVPGTNGSCVGLTYSLPLPAATPYAPAASGRDLSSNKPITSIVSPGKTTADIDLVDGTASGTNGQNYELQGSYEAQ